MIRIITKYFPDLSDVQFSQFNQLDTLYRHWNSKINVISRQDIDNLYERHILHSMSIAKVFSFVKGTSILDAGTGGGFPGIPLAIYFPDVQFHLVDSIGKKIRVVDTIVNELGLKNITTEKKRIEDLTDKYDFIISRAVASLTEFCRWVKELIKSDGMNDFPNGIIYLKGGDVTGELKGLGWEKEILRISDYFNEEFFHSKMIIYIFRSTCNPD
ncbi:MAG: 16S rRNA (guanine(527)-N(7))-methyltransferase RsmG [Bacteroidetes bacterium]|nr:16S rRNA (guanine(527)-N(7))-methyltransferase RsmG [Bacteroidota bacterium]